MMKLLLKIYFFVWLLHFHCFGGFQFGSVQSKLKVASGASLNLRNSLVLNSGTLEFLTPSLSSLSTSGASVNMINSFLKSDNNFCYFSGSLTTTTAQVITLGSGNVATFSTKDSISQSLAISSGSTATITGNPVLSSPIFLGNAASVAQLNIFNILASPVRGAGTLKLLNNLTLAKGVTLPALLNLNGYCLTMKGGTFTDALSVSGSGVGGALNFQDYTNIKAPWTIGTTGETYNLFGSGNILELSDSGSITFNGTDITISNIIIKGLSNTNQLKGSGIIKLVNTTLVLSGNFTRSDGPFYVLGANCRVISNGYNFIMSGSGNNLTVDGALFYYEQLNSSLPIGGNSPFSTTSSASIIKLNGGDIAMEPSAPAAGVGNALNQFSAASNILTRSFFITSTGLFQLNNTTTTTPLAMSIDGNGQFLDFSYANPGTFVLQPNVQLVLSNTLVKNFYPAAVSYGASSSLKFGDGVRIELGPDVTIDSFDVTWTMTGNVEIDGNGATLTINKSQGLVVGNARTLTIKNTRLVLGAVDAIKALDSSSLVRLQNVEVVIKSQGFNYSQGFLEISGLVKLIADSGITTTSVPFELSTAGNCSIVSSAELVIMPGVNFKYNINPSGNTLYTSKRHLIFSQIGSTLSMQGCTLESTDTGLALDQGTINIHDKVSIISTLGQNAEFEMGQNSYFNLGANANLNLSGPASYVEPFNYPLRYGDGFSLQHANYSTIYLGAESTTDTPGYSGVLCTGISSISNRTKFYAQPGDSCARWGNPSRIGTTIRSGDYIRFESYLSNGWVIWGTDGFGAAPVSSSPPYFRSYLAWNSHDSPSVPFRIYKKGAAIGDPIYQGDNVYFYIYTGLNYWRNLYGSQSYCYIGSKNITFSGLVETFSYRTNSSAQPSNLLTELLWKVVFVEPNAYLTAPTPWSITGGYFNSLPGFGGGETTLDSVCYFRNCINSWPAASSTQF